MSRKFLIFLKKVIKNSTDSKKANKNKKAPLTRGADDCLL
jgi:hypothetical protein